MHIKEAAFRRKVVKFISETGWKHISNTGVANTSWPDLTVVPKNHPPFFVELKRERNGKYGERKMQKALREWLTANGQTSLLLGHDDDWETLLYSAGTGGKVGDV